MSQVDVSLIIPLALVPTSSAGEIQTSMRRYMTAPEYMQMDKVLAAIPTLYMSSALSASTREVENVEVTDYIARMLGIQAPPKPLTSVRVWLLSALFVAHRLAEAAQIDAAGLTAALLYPGCQAGIFTLPAIETQFPDLVPSRATTLVRDLLRFGDVYLARVRPSLVAIENRTKEDVRRQRRSPSQTVYELETVREMFVGLPDDPAVVLIKLVEQQWRLKMASAIASVLKTSVSLQAPQAGFGLETGGLGDEVRQALEFCRVTAEETLQMYAPVARWIGLASLEGDLSDLAFAILQPEEHHRLSLALDEYTRSSSEYMRQVKEVVERELNSIGLSAEVTGRVKHASSIYRKMHQDTGDALTQLHDILAFRIILDSLEGCYLALGHIHGLWRPKEGRVKDYVAIPKPSGYQSLHTTVICLDDRLVEFQIRTRQMHEAAESMHWYYKEKQEAGSIRWKNMAQSIRRAQQVRWWMSSPLPTSTQRQKEAVLSFKELQPIFVFTPHGGSPVRLPAGATPLDFAYAIHTELGHHVGGVHVTSEEPSGRVVRHMVPLGYELKSGDVVEILKRRDAHPTRDWLLLVRTKSARQAIMRYLKDHERDIDLQIGRERLDHELRVIGLRKGFEELAEEDLTWLAKALDQPDVDSLLVAVGSDKLRLSTVIGKLREHLQPSIAEPHSEEPFSVRSSAREFQTRASVAGVSGMLTQLANCCDPLPGDALLGFISRSRGVVIHRADCATLVRLLERQPNRGVEVGWPTKLEGQQSFRAPIVIAALDRTGLLADVTGIITGMKINMLSVSTVTRPKQRHAVITATLEIQRPEQLTAVLKELEKVAGVQTVERRRVGK